VGRRGRQDVRALTTPFLILPHFFRHLRLLLILNVLMLRLLWLLLLVLFLFCFLLRLMWLLLVVVVFHLLHLWPLQYSS
jgi:hypothetical protein